MKTREWEIFLALQNSVYENKSLGKGMQKHIYRARIPGGIMGGGGGGYGEGGSKRFVL